MEQQRYDVQGKAWTAQVLRTRGSQPLSHRCSGCVRVSEDEVISVDIRILSEATGRTVTKRRWVAFLTTLIAEVAVLERSAAGCCQRVAFAEQVARGARVAAKADCIETVRGSDLCQRARLEDGDVAIVLDVCHRLIACRSSGAAVIGKTVSRSNEQVVSARRNRSAIWNDTDENRSITACGAHLEQAIADTGAGNDMW